MKRCSRCSETKPLNAFHRSRRTRDGRTYWCRQCSAEHYQETRGEKLRYTARQRVLKRYGLDLDEYMRLLAQGCTVCGSHERVGIDHDHARNAVRAPLCHGCNMALGYAKDDPQRLRALAAYAQRMNDSDLEPIPKYVGFRAKPLPVEKVRAMYESGMTQKAIAEHFDCSSAHVSNTMTSAGILRRPNGTRYLLPDMEEARRLYEDEGLTVRQVAERLQTDKQRLWIAMRRAGVQMRPRGTRSFASS